MKFALPTGVALAVCVTLAQAQIIQAGTGVLEWQALTSQGWQSGSVIPESPTIHVRLVASWQVPAAHSYFGQTFMDVVVAGATPSDALQNLHILRPPVNGNPGVCSWYADLMKIDLPGDTLAPGAGSLWVHPYQNMFEGYIFDNPLPLYEFDLVLGSVEGNRSISSVHRAMSGGRYMQVIDADSLTGLSYLVDTDIRTLNIVPVPSVAGVVLIPVAIAHCRRRRKS